MAFGNFPSASNVYGLSTRRGLTRAQPSNQSQSLASPSPSSSVSYAIRGLNVDLAYTRKQMTSPTTSDSATRSHHRNTTVNELLIAANINSKQVSERDEGLLRRYGALKDSRLTSDTEELLNRIRQRQQDQAQQVKQSSQSLPSSDAASGSLASSAAYHRRQDLTSSRQWFQHQQQQRGGLY